MPATVWSPSPPGTSGHRPSSLGLVDEVAMDVVPVVFGSGKRYFGAVAAQHLLEDPEVVVRATGCCTSTYRVRS